MRTLIVLALLTLALSSGLEAQAYGEVAALAGADSVRAVVTVDWDERIPRPSEAAFTRDAESAFDLGLLRAGVTLDDDGDLWLICSVNVLWVPDSDFVDGGTIAYSVEVALQGLAVAAPSYEARYAQVWEAEGVGVAGTQNFDGDEDIGEWCAERFELAWRRANQGR